MEMYKSRARICYLIILFLLVVSNFVPVPVSAHMLVITVCIIYIGSLATIPGQFREQEVENLETSDAMWFPIIISVLLFSLYLVFKFFPKEYVNFVIKAYFLIFGIGVLGNKVAQIGKLFLPKQLTNSLTAKEFSIDAPYFKKEDKDGNKTLPYNLTFTPLDVASFIISTIVATCYVYTDHWTTSNILGIAFAIQGIELIGLGSFKNGAILLSGLFFYDIFWVFGTDVMLSVAKKFDAPIKLLFPQMDADKRPSMLGLGDIVIPGIFIALILRFDWSLAEDKNNVSLTYFHSTLVAYFLGLGTTVIVMYKFEAAQPALLYLVPACLLSSLLVAAVKGQLKELCSYTEEEEEEEKGKEENQKEKEIDNGAHPQKKQEADQTAEPSSSSSNSKKDD